MSQIYNELAYERAIHRNIINNALKTFRKNPDNEKVYNYLFNVELKNQFLQGLQQALQQFGKLSPKQVEAVIRTIDGEAERKAEYAKKNAEANAKSVYVGEVGGNITLDLKLKKVIEIQGVPFSYYDSGITYLNIFAAPDGNCVVYKGKKYICPEGITVKVKANIKEFKEYNGCKQTVIQRPKVLKELPEVCLN